MMRFTNWGMVEDHVSDREAYLAWEREQFARGGWKPMSEIEFEYHLACGDLRYAAGFLPHWLT